MDASFRQFIFHKTLQKSNRTRKYFVATKKKEIFAEPSLS